MNEHIKLIRPFELTNLVYIIMHLTPWHADCAGNIGIVTEVNASGDPVSIRCNTCKNENVIWQRVDPTKH